MIFLDNFRPNFNSTPARAIFALKLTLLAHNIPLNEHKKPMSPCGSMITAREGEEDEDIETTELADIEDHQAQGYLADR